MTEFSRGEIQRAALDMIGAVQARASESEAEMALSWCVISIDTETTIEQSSYLTVYGGFEDPISAMAWADEHDRSVNVGLGPDEAPWHSIVKPVLPSAL